jgi:hypothetical protein
MTSGLSAQDVVRQRVHEGLRQRRARKATRAVVEVAPWAAAAVTIVSLVVRLAHWPAWIAWTTIGVGAIGLVAWFLWLRRVPTPTDAMAASLDEGAGLGGELRSAFWFAQQREPAPWAAFHLDRAAERVTVLNWSDFYPAVRATRAWAVTGVFVVAAIALGIHIPPGHVAPRAGAAKAATGPADDVPLELLLPPDVRRKLEDLLAQIENGKIAAAAANAKLKELQDLLSKIDPSLDPALAKLAKQAAEASLAENKTADAKSLAERAKADAQAALPPDLKEQLEDLASRLANPRLGARQGESAERSASGDQGQLSKASNGANAQQANAAEAAMQLSREAASDPQSGQMMLAGAGQMGGDSSAGAGGNSGGKSNSASAALIAQALKREMIEASADVQGQNITSEDIRRKTEQGKSSLGFTHVIPPPTIDPSRTLPPPPVPDARKPLVMQYFIRRQ